MNALRIRHTMGQVALHVTLLTIGLLFIMPFVWSLSTSLKPLTDLFHVTPNLIPSELRWQNYADVFHTLPFGRFYVNTVIVTILRTAGQLLIASMAAFAFSQMRFPGRDMLFFLLLTGLMVPDQILIIPRYIIMRNFDWLDSYQGLIIPLLFSSFGTFLLRQYFLGLPSEFNEAAKIEGANPFQIYWSIYLPLARPALAAYGFLTILWSWNEFLWALTITNRTDMQVLSVGIALFRGQYFTNNAILLASANLATFPLLILFILFQRQLVEGIALTGLK